MRPLTILLTLAGAAVLGACGESRPPTAGRDPVSPTYQEIKPLLARRCVSCHSATNLAGGYDLSSYVGILGPGSDDVRNAIAGDGTSRLLLKLVNDPKHWERLLPSQSELAAGESAEERRSKDFDLLKRWVIARRLAYFDIGVHPPSWVYAAKRNSPEFHGGVLRQSGWELDACRGCHGSDLRGGSSGRSCYTCHEQGLDSCSVCHGSASRPGASGSAPPADLSWNLSRGARGVGAHQIHLRDRTWWAAIKCEDCHVVPRRLDSAGHLFDAAGGTRSDLKAELTFGKRAAQLDVKPTYDVKSGVCSVYCHGVAFPGAMQGTRPSWTGTEGGQCGSCHQVPAVAGGPDCATCHPQSVKACTPSPTDPDCLQTAVGVGTRFLDPSLHGDGKYPLGHKGVEGTCYACHGTKQSSGAPPADLRGNTDISATTVGLHARHLGQGNFANPVPCASCHQVPTSMTDPGHFDDDLPAEVLFSDQARGKLQDPSSSLAPAWDRSSGSCSGTYCHSLDGGKVGQWTWTKTLDPPLACDSCHGQPPAKTLKSGSHPSATDCKTCHGSAYDGNGQLDPAKHINGKVDL